MPDTITESYLATIQAQKVYYFRSPLLSSDLPHYFICVENTNDILMFTTGTTQLEKKETYVNKGGLPFSTLVYINPSDAGASFTQNTYVNCNTAHRLSKSDFLALHANRDIRDKGILDDHYYDQIVKGLIDSPVIPEEWKEDLNKGDTSAYNDIFSL